MHDIHHLDERPKRARRRILGAGLALVTLAGATGLAPDPAAAALGDCPANRACSWDATSYGGLPNGTWQNFIQYVATSNTASSVNNNLTATATCWYDGSSYTNLMFVMFPLGGPGQWRDPALSNGVVGNGTNFDNRVSSAQTC
jgi:hypothetical protein